MRLRDGVIRARDEPAVAEREEVLRREEAECRADAGRRNALRAERLCGVFEQRDAQRGQLCERRAPAEEVDRDDRLRPLGDATPHVGGVEVERDGVDVREHRGRADPGDRLGSGVERERGADHLVPSTDAHRLERQDERIGAVRDADPVRDAERCSGLVLEGLDLWAEDEAAGLEHLGETPLELRDVGARTAP